MAQPNIAQVSIGAASFRAIGVHFGLSTLHAGIPGTPLMGSVACSISVLVDLNDRVNMPFQTLNTIFNLAYGVTREKIQDIVLTYWSDDAADDVICTYSFRGWISNYVTSTGNGGRGSQVAGADGTQATNHVLTLTLQPELDSNNFVKIQLGN